MPILTAYAFNGDALDALLGTFDGQGLYGDGMNLYCYLGANPAVGTDPLGLDEYDDLIDELTGHRLYALGTINEYARAASVGLETALEIASALLGIDVFRSVIVIADGGGGFWESMDIVCMAMPGSGPLRAISKMRKFKRLARGVSYFGKMIGHHTVPNAVLKALRADVRTKGRVHGMKGCKNIWKIPEDLHKDLHRGARGGPWNDRSWQELHALGGAKNAEVDDVVRIREKLIREFDLGDFRP